MSIADAILEALHIKCDHKWRRKHAIPGGMVLMYCSKCDGRLTKYDQEHAAQRERAEALESGRLRLGK
jgi:hypothetical protein